MKTLLLLLFIAFLIIVDFKAGIGLLFIFISYQTYLFFYFRSKSFINVKEGIKKYINDCNDLNHHIGELKCAYVNVETIDYGSGTLQDTSRYNFKRKEWSKSLRNNYVHNCSSTVCKNASTQPFKYLCKYFNIKIDENSLENFENILNDFSAADQGKTLLIAERDRIVNNLKDDVPFLIFSLNRKKLIKKLGFEIIDLSDLHYPVYTFQYVSAGGNSSIRFDLKLDIENLNKFVNYLNDLVKFRKSIEGQRALMTSKLRETIKNRDNFTCQMCSISTHLEQNLLLEIDHIIPLSKGGITSESNLQTLCWRCNRSKGNKIIENM